MKATRTVPVDIEFIRRVACLFTVTYDSHGTPIPKHVLDVQREAAEIWKKNAALLPVEV